MRDGVVDGWWPRRHAPCSHSCTRDSLDTLSCTHVFSSREGARRGTRRRGCCNDALSDHLIHDQSNSLLPPDTLVSSALLALHEGGAGGVLAGGGERSVLCSFTSRSFDTALALATRYYCEVSCRIKTSTAVGAMVGQSAAFHRSSTSPLAVGD